ncbi:LamG-like jellyroll fold domain-containing protein [Paucihalobacter ruber]|nr:LamG-like jellyroll fold domain-containing protein [Paucihalobacter ruber]
MIFAIFNAIKAFCFLSLLLLISIPDYALLVSNNIDSAQNLISKTPSEYPLINKVYNKRITEVLITNRTNLITANTTYERTSAVVNSGAVNFNGVSDLIDMGNQFNLDISEFTISLWIKRGSNSENTSILSKRDMAFTEGYDLKINHNGQLEMTWKNEATQSITSNTVIPVNQWHQVSVVYKDETLSLYIDGVLDKTSRLSLPLATESNFMVGAAGATPPTNFFKGDIDEIRIWSAALSERQLRFIMNQEILEKDGFVNGAYFESLNYSLSKNDLQSIPWQKLEGYYPMSTFIHTTLKDESGYGRDGILANLSSIVEQTAPLPYQSSNNGHWNDNNSWYNGNVQYIPGSASIVDPQITIDWNIVTINHHISMDNSFLPSGKKNNLCLLSLEVGTNTLTIEGENHTQTGNALTITHYLKLDGVLDLEGESQLIQTLGSDFDVKSSGRLEREQQGTADMFTYNYWSSPVGTRNTTTNNNSYRLPNVIQNVNFISNSFNGTASPVGIADFWIWKYASLSSGQYAAWSHVRSTGSILAGEGFTMKGPGTGTFNESQNYVFSGKPNNGNIALIMAPESDYLVGNPYPSAIDADVFILENTPTLGGTGAINGTLFFWEHWGGGSHNSQEFRGGYATYNLSGGTPSASHGAYHPDFGMGGVPRKTPRKHIPVGQGFFVKAANSGGTINFNNGQRIFEKDDGSLSGNSVFWESFIENYYRIGQNETDPRMKFRFGLKSVNDIQRQLLLTIDEKATAAADWGYDAVLNETQIDDMYWLIEDENYVIQGSDVLDEFVRYPVGIKLANAGMNVISINVLENVPADITVYIHDKDLDYYHNLNENPYEFHSMAGEHLNRFEILFNQEYAALSVGDDEFKSLNAVYANANESIILINLTLIEIKSMILLNLIGQTVTTINNISVSPYSEYEVKNLSSGTYIIKINTASGLVSKKVLID